jgi:isochorismate hydrolase
MPVDTSGMGCPTAGARILAMPKAHRERAPAHDLVRVDAVRETSPESLKLRRMAREDFNMILFCAVLVTGSLALASVGAMAQQAPAANKQMQTVQMPATPNPARVTLNPKTTALIVLDFVEDICNPQPSCTGKMLPAMTPFLEQARKAGLPVVYGTRERNMTMWLKEVAPTDGDIKIMSMAQDRFFRTSLDKELKARGIRTVILAGWKVSGSVTYTSVGAMAHDYTVVIPMDTTSAGSDYETIIGFYNVLNSGNANLTNQPLKAGSVTLSRTDMITFQ